MRQRFGELVEEATEMGHLPVTVTYSSRYRPKTVSTRQFLRLFAGCSDYLPAPLVEAVGELFFETFGADLKPRHVGTYRSAARRIEELRLGQSELALW